MEPTTAVWRGLTLGHDTDFRIRELEGWEELPSARYDKTPRSNAHGAHPSEVWSDERIVTITGWSWSSTDRDRLLRQLRAHLAFGDAAQEPLTITVAGRTLTAGAQLIAARPALIRGEWGIGRFGWVAQWRCPDPLRYGPTLTDDTALPSSGGGLQYNLYKPGKLDYGPAGVLGRITLVNEGSAPAPIRFAVLGAHDVGFEISGGGKRLTYAAPVPSGVTVELDTATGDVLVEGTASRRGNLSAADWMLIPAASVDGTAGQLTVQFTSLGGVRDPAALLTATWAEANW